MILRLMSAGLMRELVILINMHAPNYKDPIITP